MSTTLLELSRGLMRFTVEVVGDDDVRIGLSRAATTVGDWTSFWTDYFAPKFYGDIAQNFATSGRLVGGWAPLSPVYAAWKDRNYPGQPIMRLTDALFESLTQNGPQAIFDPRPDGLSIGTSVPYAAKHQIGEGNLPQRQIVFIGNADEYRQLLQRWVRGVVRAATGKESAA